MRSEQDIQRALLDPPAVYDAPSDVVSDQHLSKAQKIEILRRWEYDAREISVAEDEGMTPRDGSVLQAILLTLEQMIGDLDTEKSPPTKHGGLARSAVSGKKGGT